MYNKQFMVINARRTPDKKQVRMKRYKVFDKQLYKVHLAALATHQQFNDNENRRVCVTDYKLRHSAACDGDKDIISKDDSVEIKSILHKGYMFYFVPE